MKKSLIYKNDSRSDEKVMKKGALCLSKAESDRQETKSKGNITARGRGVTSRALENVTSKNIKSNQLS